MGSARKPKNVSLQGFKFLLAARSSLCWSLAQLMSLASWAVQRQHRARPWGLSLQPSCCMLGWQCQEPAGPWTTEQWAGQTPGGCGHQTLLQELIGDWAAVLGQDTILGCPVSGLCTEWLGAWPWRPRGPQGLRSTEQLYASLNQDTHPLDFWKKATVFSQGQWEEPGKYTTIKWGKDGINIHKFIYALTVLWASEGLWVMSWSSPALKATIPSKGPEKTGLAFISTTDKELLPPFFGHGQLLEALSLPWGQSASLLILHPWSHFCPLDQHCLIEIECKPHVSL